MLELKLKSKAKWADVTCSCVYHKPIRHLTDTRVCHIQHNVNFIAPVSYKICFILAQIEAGMENKYAYVSKIESLISGYNSYTFQ